MIYSGDRRFTYNKNHITSGENKTTRFSPMTEEKPEDTLLTVRGEVGSGGGAGLGAVLHGSRPSESYTELAKGFSTTKLPPKFGAAEAL